MFLFDRRIVDRWVLILAAILIGLYVLNVGSGHGTAWAQGVRLTGEPLVLLLVGMILPDPRRTFRWALATLIGTGCLVAAYGIFQQLVGKWTLVEWGYSFEAQVRSLGNGQLRSFGTLDDPFAYAAFLLFALAAVFFWLRKGPIAWGAGTLILIGLAVLVQPNRRPDSDCLRGHRPVAPGACGAGAARGGRGDSRKCADPGQCRRFRVERGRRVGERAGGNGWIGQRRPQRTDIGLDRRARRRSRRNG